jgi:peptidase E
MDSRRIVGLGGFPHESTFEYVLGLARGRKVLVDGTASPQWTDPPPLPGELTPLSFYPWPPPELRELALAHDVILVCGGNTANLLAVWRVHGFDRILREAWESGVVLAGWSAGMICWFEAGVTDSFGPELAGLRDGLGFLPGSACPHYDGEELRRPVYRRLVAEEGFPPGIACDDAAGVHYAGTELVEVVSSAPGSTAYRVGPDGEVPLENVRIAADDQTLQ